MFKMLLLNDVWANFVEGEKYGYNVYHFEEWRKDDNVELFDTIPLLKVDEQLFTYIENTMGEIQEDLLAEVKNKAKMRRNHQLLTAEYAFIITDGKRNLAVNTLGYHIPIRKSRLVPRHEQYIFEVATRMQVDFTYKPSNYTNDDYDDIYIDPNSMRGLTRRERKLKELLYTVIQDIMFDENIGKLKYLYTELNPYGYKDVKEVNLESTYETINKYIAAGWTKTFEEALKVITKGISYYEDMLELEEIKDVKYAK